MFILNNWIVREKSLIPVTDHACKQTTLRKWLSEGPSMHILAKMPPHCSILHWFSTFDQSLLPGPCIEGLIIFSISYVILLQYHVLPHCIVPTGCLLMSIFNFERVEHPLPGGNDLASSLVCQHILALAAKLPLINNSPHFT